MIRFFLLFNDEFYEILKFSKTRHLTQDTQIIIFFSKFHHKNIDTKETKVYSISTFARINGCLAQLVEQWTVNPCVAGSKPAAAAKDF